MIRQAIRSGLHAFFKTITITIGVGCGMFVVFVLLALLIGNQEADLPGHIQKRSLNTIYGDESSKSYILSIPIKGVIVGDESELAGVGSFLDSGVTAGYEVQRQLRDAAKNKKIKAVVLDINSPGGTIYGAHAIADAVAEYRQATKHPVYAFVSGIAASGAYWSAASADTIIADYGSQTGSVGVISGPYTFYDDVTAQQASLIEPGIVTQNGIEQIYITAGTSKDLGNPYRRMTDAEVKHEQTAVNNEYNLFVQYIASRRHVSAATIKSNWGALVFENERAVNQKLIDTVGNRQFAYKSLAQSANIEDSYQVVEEESVRSLISTLLFSKANTQPVSACSILKRAAAPLVVSQTYVSSCQYAK